MKTSDNVWPIYHFFSPDYAAKLLSNNGYADIDIKSDVEKIYDPCIGNDKSIG